MNTWHFPSNSGLRTITFTSCFYDRESNSFTYIIHLSGNTYKDIEGELSRTDGETQDFEVALHSVIIEGAACKVLLEHFKDWLVSFAPFCCNLSSLPGQYVELQVAEREGLITSKERPAVTFRYRSPGCNFEIFFVVDQSCIRIAIDGLAAVLEESSDGEKVSRTNGT